MPFVSWGRAGAALGLGFRADISKLPPTPPSPDGLTVGGPESRFVFASSLFRLSDLLSWGGRVAFLHGWGPCLPFGKSLYPVVQLLGWSGFQDSP